MTRPIDSLGIAQIDSGSIRPVIIVKIEAPAGDILITSHTMDVVYGGETYTYGTLGNISPVSETGTLESGIAITLSGVDVPTMAAVSSGDFINSPVTVRMLFLDDSWSVSGSGLLLFSGNATGAPVINYGAVSDIAIQCQDKFTALDRERTERYSDASQQAEYPGDLGMQYAATVASKEVRWPAASFFEG